MRKPSAQNKLINTTIELLQEKPLSKLTVSEIVQSSSLSRKTFYTYYADKYDLINQIFNQDADQCSDVNTMINGLDQNLLKILILMKSRQEFYTKAFQYQGQNSLTSFLKDLIYMTHATIIVPIMDERILKEKLEYHIRFHACSIAAVFTDWAINGMHESPETVTQLILESMPNMLKNVYNFDSTIYS